MRNVVLGCAVIAALAGFYFADRWANAPKPAAETSCAQIIHHYLHATSTAVGVQLTHEHLLACRQDGDEAVARVSFVVHQTGLHDQREVLSVRLVKALWWAADAHVVG